MSRLNCMQLCSVGFQQSTCAFARTRLIFHQKDMQSGEVNRSVLRCRRQDFGPRCICIEGQPDDKARSFALSLTGH